MIEDNAWMKLNPGKYAIYRDSLLAWHVTRDSIRIALCSTFEEAIKTAEEDSYMRKLQP